MSIGPIYHPDTPFAQMSATRPSSKSTTGAFAAALAQGIQRADMEVKQADHSVERMVESRGANLHEAMIALDRADIATRLTAKIGQKLVQAYQEVSRMQV